MRFIFLIFVMAFSACTTLDDGRTARLDRDAIADLDNGGDSTSGLEINTLFVNRSGVTGLQQDTFLELDIIQNDDPVFRTAQSRNIQELNEAGADPFNPDQRVEIRFENDPLTLVVDQLLGGLLSANYIAATPLQGTVDFETRAPVLRSEIPTILRDILGAQGYVMKLINGVYQIGAPETIEQLELNAAAGASSEFETRVIRIERGDLNEIADVVARILPLGATVTPVPNDGSLIVSASAADITAVVNLVNTLVDTGVAQDLVSIVTLQRSAPESVAASLLSYYEQRGTPRSRIPIVIPLENQQSLLLGARDAGTMNNARQLIRSMDRDLRDTASLRIIPMTHLPAAEIAAQLNQIFGGGITPNIALNQTAAPASTSVPVPANIRAESAAETAPPEAELAQAASASPVGISIVPDSRNNALLVFATFEQFKRIREVVQALDLPLAQVVIEATIVEVDVNNNLSFGVQSFLNRSNLSVRSASTTTPADPGTAGFFGSFTAIGGSSVDVVLNALESVTDVRIISSPYLTVLDGSSARLSIGDQVPFLTSSTDAETDGTTTTTNEIEIRDTGVILEVTPSIGADNSVLLNIVQEVSSVAPAGAEVNQLTPTIQQRTITSDIVVQSGRTALLGGLIQDSQIDVTTGVPVVSDIPVVGELFKQTTNDVARTELLVMITPRVVRKPSQLDNITRQLREGLSR
ncbi:secretin N-terminal domain-containing protein [Yoonia sp. BS5-3]|uniref:Secretin N-terminal domain-containing protein n=1 Tax=Yoonia phaeophyticola TaxID=3137369 RepID=A0ABZ2V7E8_9RHOB